MTSMTRATGPTAVQTVSLNSGGEMPVVGLGVFQMDDAQVREIVPAAVEAGYRLIDTASRYYNEEAVGRALAELDVPREELFITTKLWFKDHGEGRTLDALRVFLDNLGLDYLTLPRAPALRRLLRRLEGHGEGPGGRARARHRGVQLLPGPLPRPRHPHRHLSLIHI